ncbi:unnamed protein product [Oikopleura dioica]|uniref:Uncharacterized protein n=1 Tax=Oikopleura dioica TaxID=34765 RepID=E4XMG0_OIKDI|nr:unnamed protein product [Oikopleura dioica]
MAHLTSSSDSDDGSDIERRLIIDEDQRAKQQQSFADSGNQQQKSEGDVITISSSDCGTPSPKIRRKKAVVKKKTTIVKRKNSKTKTVTTTTKTSNPAVRSEAAAAEAPAKMAMDDLAVQSQNNRVQTRAGANKEKKNVQAASLTDSDDSFTDLIEVKEEDIDSEAERERFFRTPKLTSGGASASVLSAPTNETVINEPISHEACSIEAQSSAELSRAPRSSSDSKKRKNTAGDEDALSREPDHQNAGAGNGCVGGGGVEDSVFQAAKKQATVASVKKATRKTAGSTAAGGGGASRKKTKEPQARPRRVKATPKGTHCQFDWHSLKAANAYSERPTNDQVAPPNLQKIRLIRSSSESTVPREPFDSAPDAFDLGNTKGDGKSGGSGCLPLNLPRRGSTGLQDQNEEELMRQLDPLELATDSEPEDGERFAYLSKLSKEGPSWQLNRFQLRQSFAAAFNSKFGIRPSLADSRLASFFQRLARDHYQAERIAQVWNEATFRVHYENVRGGDSFESFFTQVGSAQGQRKKFDRLGAFYTCWSIDGFGHWFIQDIKIWVSQIF